MAQKFDFIVHNQAAWDKQALEQKPWSQPVSSELIAAAKQGEWEVHITPRPLPKSWLGDVTNKNILCLASAGGQQGPVLAAAGAVVSVFDLSEGPNGGGTGAAQSQNGTRRHARFECVSK